MSWFWDKHTRSENYARMRAAVHARDSVIDDAFYELAERGRRVDELVYHLDHQGFKVKAELMVAGDVARTIVLPPVFVDLMADGKKINTVRIG